MNTLLFRPVGLRELGLIWDSEMREFPPRLAHQPIFYPVANVAYARQIARDWNVKDEKSAYAGFLTFFTVTSDFMSRFPPHTVGSVEHVEYWIPAEELGSFNSALQGKIRVGEGFFGSGFEGHIAENFQLKGKNAIAQFVTLCEIWESSRLDVAHEIEANRKSVFLNWLFWARHDFSEFGVGTERRDGMLGLFRECWTMSQIAVSLPGLEDV